MCTKAMRVWTCYLWGMFAHNGNESRGHFLKSKVRTRRVLHGYVRQTKHWTLGTMIHIKLLERSLARSRHSRNIFQHHLFHHHHCAEQRGNPRVCEKHWASAFYSYQPEARKSDKQIGKNLKYVARAEHQPQKPPANVGAGWGLEMQGFSLQKVETAFGDVCHKPWVFHEFKVCFSLFLISMNLWDPYGNHLGRECHHLPQQISTLIYFKEIRPREGCMSTARRNIDFRA